MNLLCNLSLHSGYLEAKDGEILMSSLRQSAELRLRDKMLFSCAVFVFVLKIQEKSQ